MPTPRVTIVGGSGFVGQALLGELHAEGVEAVGLNSDTLDLTSPDCLDTLCAELDRRTVLIVVTRSRHAHGSFEGFMEDVAMATNIARALERCPVARCLYFSSVSVYGDSSTNLEVTEETPIAPTNPYGAAKFVGECLIGQVARETAIPFVCLRPCKIYGPGDHLETYGPARFIRSMMLHGQVTLFGDGSELRDYVFYRDVVRITVQFALGDRVGTFNVASGQSHSFQQIVACVAQLTGRDVRIEYVERDRPKVDQGVNPARLLAALPGFRFTDLEQGLAETSRYFETNLLQKT
ncbi:MAG: NAD(P)-dependent oxidoreductase [Gemmatimonadota bacterium]|nr:NAD(P)-dependent oxidoreductase [Gemmatimonadota bacterium]